MSRLDLFCSVDEFWWRFEPQWRQQVLSTGGRRRWRTGQLPPSELMTMVLLFQQSDYRTFKAYYTRHVQAHRRDEFPHLVSYSRFVELLPRVLVPLTVYLHTQLGQCSGISFIDSTALAVCENARIGQHQVFAVAARRGKTAVGWFYGFKRHLVVNDRGELLAFGLTPGNIDDRRPVPRLVPRLVRSLFGKLFGDRGYSSHKLAEELFISQGVRLITKLRKTMRNRLLPVADKLLLRKRALIESIVDQLKNICQIEHSRHRSPFNFLVHLMAGLVASCHQPKKPSLDLGLPTLPAAA